MHPDFRPDVLTEQQVSTLDAVARRLAQRYPPDWLERQGQPIYVATLAASFLVALVLSIWLHAWWSFLVPLLAPSLILLVLPQWLFGRRPDLPRWAHPRATLERGDAELVRHVIRASRAGAVAPLTGDVFHDIWRQARGVPGCHTG